MFVICTRQGVNSDNNNNNNNNNNTSNDFRFTHSINHNNKELSTLHAIK